MNRALIVQSFEPRLKLLGKSQCDDVIHLQKSLKNLHRTALFDCGDGGTTLRFLAFRVSRQSGRFLLRGSARLLSRPQDEIKNILEQLGVRVRLQKNGLLLISDGWKKPSGPVVVHAKDSSQFLSALCLNAWDLDFDLKIKIQGKITSHSYFQMTLKLLKELGFKWTRRGSMLLIPRGQKVKTHKCRVESDLSSLFSVAAFAGISGKAIFQDFPPQSLQPDLAFIKIFQKMGIACSHKGRQLVVTSPEHLKPIRVDLQNSPDLFPVLAVLCSFCAGRSVLHGAPQLAVKESNRIEKTAELLKKAGVLCKPRKDGMEIQGQAGPRRASAFSFDPDHDHRLAMAAALLKFFGQNIKIKDPEVVRKSFPEFWRYVGVKP